MATKPRKANLDATPVEALTEPIYDLQTDESSPAWNAFRLYRDMGEERSLAAVCQVASKDRAQIGRWSRKWRWVERVRAWERHLDQVRRDEQVEQTRKMVERHATQLQGATQAMIAPITALLRRVQEQGGEAGLFKNTPNYHLSNLAIAAARALPLLVKAERLSRGLSETSIDVTGGLDLTVETVPSTATEQLVSRLNRTRDELAARRASHQAAQAEQAALIEAPAQEAATASDPAPTATKPPSRARVRKTT